MSSLRQLGSGFLYALVSVVLVVGGLSLALAEGGFKTAASTASPNPSATVVAPSASPAGSSTANETSTAAISSPTAGASASLQTTVLTATPMPPSATSYYASPFPTATPYYYVSPYPTATHSAVPCGPYAGWVLSYTVQPGDTLYHIATQYRTTVTAVQIANCKPTTVIFAGERLWVPNVPTVTPGVTFVPTFPTSTPVPTEPLTLTPLPTFTDTAVPTDTLVPNP
jgi:LysM repeat protein